MNAPIERVDTRAFQLATEDGPESDGTTVWVLGTSSGIFNRTFGAPAP